MFTKENICKQKRIRKVETINKISAKRGKVVTTAPVVVRCFLLTEALALDCDATTDAWSADRLHFDAVDVDGAEVVPVADG